METDSFETGMLLSLLVSMTTVGLPNNKTTAARVLCNVCVMNTSNIRGMIQKEEAPCESLP